MSCWVDCPACGEDDMELVGDRVHCTNLCCENYATDVFGFADPDEEEEYEECQRQRRRAETVAAALASPGPRERPSPLAAPTT